MCKITKFSILLVSCVQAVIAWAQSVNHTVYDVEVDYEMTYYPDSNERSIQKEYMELLINDRESVFQSKRKGRLDSARYANIASGAKVSADFLYDNATKFRYYIVKSKDSIVTRDEYRLSSEHDYHYYVEHKKDFNWILREDTTSIGGMLCQLAEVDFGGRRWMAWFTTEIPMSEGPYKFSGLPGLILSMKDTTGDWRFDFVGVRNIARKVPTFYDWTSPPSFTDKKKFFKEKKYYNENKVILEEAAGRIRFRDAEQRSFALKKSIERAAKDNNWIELFP